jgi:transcriptional antiterminator
MDVENTFIKPVLKSYFNKGVEEYEAYREISNKYGPRAITLKTINKWFAKFRADDIRRLNLANCSKQKFTDEYLIDLVNNNPGLNKTQLAKLANTSISTISARLKQVNSKGERAKYIWKSFLNDKLDSCTRPKKFTDEYLIELVKENPDLNLAELAVLADASRGTIIKRMKQINSRGDRIKYISKGIQKGQKKFTDEYIVNLVNDNPDLNMKELASYSNSSESYMSIRIKQINSNGEKVNYTAKRNRTCRKKVTDECLIDLINNNPSLNMSELATLANVSQRTISRRIKQIKDQNIETNYIKKVAKMKQKFTDEFLINLINDNPKLNMKELSNLAGASISTIYNRLKKINSNGERVKYISKNK